MKRDPRRLPLSKAHLAPTRAMIAIAFALVTAWSGTSAAESLRPDAPAVMDLSLVTRLQPYLDGALINVATLPADVASAITKAKDVTIVSDKPADGVLVPSILEGKALQKAEQASLAKDAATITRTGKKLSIKPQAGGAVEFLDRSWASSKNADDGGSETFFYLGRTGAEHYLRIEERYSEDSPGTFLVNPANGGQVYTHNAEETAVLSPGGKLLASLGYEVVTLVSLDAAGPALRVTCMGDQKVATAGSGANDTAFDITFKGWHGDTAFDVLLSVGDPHEKGAVLVPARFTQAADGWQVAAADVAWLAKKGILCRRGRS